MCDKLLNEFNGLLKTCKQTNKDGVIVYNHLLEPDDVERRAGFDDKSLKDAAFYIRKQILLSEITNLLVPIMVEAIHVGQVSKQNL